MMFAPAFSGIAAMLQFADACAVPENPWLVAHSSATVPAPPDKAPANAIDEAVVETGGTWITKNSGVAGVDVGVPGLLGVPEADGLEGEEGPDGLEGVAGGAAACEPSRAA